jgi:hypothetical protein
VHDPRKSVTAVFLERQRENCYRLREMMLTRNLFLVTMGSEGIRAHDAVGERQE